MPATTNQGTEETSATANVSSIEAFKQQHLIQLPSGFVVRIRRLNISSLIRSGRIPNHLVNAAYKVVSVIEDDPAEVAKRTDEEKREQADNISLALDAITIALVADPPLVMSEEEENEQSVWVGRLTDADKMTVMNLAQAGLAFLDSFRPRTPGKDDRQDSAEVRRVTKRRARAGV